MNASKNIIKEKKPIYNKIKYGDKKYLWVKNLTITKINEEIEVEKNTKILNIISLFSTFKSKSFGITRRIIPI